ncbi:MAG: lipoprotein [Acutalibacteraceae bacterium]
MKKIIFILIFTLILSACQTPKSRENYLSITVTSYNDGVTPESGMTTTVYCLDLKSNEIENKWSFERSAQYPLAVYSRYDNSVYYTQRVEDYKNGKGDQLFSKNLTTGEMLQLSTDIFGINYIVPLDADRIVYVAAKKQSHILSVFLYDKKTDSTTMANLPEDMSIQLLSYNAFTGKLIGSGRFETEERAAAEISNQGRGQRFIPPDHYIFDFTEFDDVKLLYKTENMLIQRLASDSDKNIIFTQADTNRGWEPEFFTYHYDVKKNKLKPLENLDASLYINEFLFCADDRLYFIGVDEFNEEENPRGIYSYNLSTKETKLLFTSENGWINNFTLL